METVKKLNQCASAVLTGKMGEDYCCDVGVLDPLVDQTDACVVDCYDCVLAISSYVLHESVGVVIWAEVKAD